MKICPICTIVSGTWIALLLWRADGHAVDAALIATLIGGSAVGIAYLLRERTAAARRTAFMLVFVPAGLAAAYAAAVQAWHFAALAVIGAALITVAFTERRGHPGTVRNWSVAEAERKLKECC
ncbi:MAG TPA: hypothetical protein VD862_04605 [Candidatus Paceibacterota bacterium]|nr:hypothetical protein [Candidatus Paceibacterota bacterium]